MFWNKMAFFGVAAVMATAVIPAAAQNSTTSAMGGGVVNVSGEGQWTFNIQAVKITRGATSTSSGRIVLYRSDNNLVQTSAAITKLEWFGANMCCASGSLTYNHTPAKIEFFVSKESNQSSASWRITRRSDNVVLYSTGMNALNALAQNPLIYGSVTLNAPR